MAAEGVWVVWIGLAAGACAASLGCVVGSRYAAEVDPDNVNWQWLTRAWSCETCGVRLAAWRTVPAVGGWLARAAGGCRGVRRLGPPGVAPGGGGWRCSRLRAGAAVGVGRARCGLPAGGHGCRGAGRRSRVCRGAAGGWAVPLLWSGLLVGPAGRGRRGSRGLRPGARWSGCWSLPVRHGDGCGSAGAISRWWPPWGAWAGSASMIAVAGACGCCAVGRLAGPGTGGARSRRSW